MNYFSFTIFRNRTKVFICDPKRKHYRNVFPTIFSKLSTTQNYWVVCSEILWKLQWFWFITFFSFFHVILMQHSLLAPTSEADRTRVNLVLPWKFTGKAVHRLIPKVNFLYSQVREVCHLYMKRHWPRTLRTFDPASRLINLCHTEDPQEGEPIELKFYVVVEIKAGCDFRGSKW